MGSTLLFKVRICFMSPQLTSTARFLCTRNIKPNLGQRKNSRQTRPSNTTIKQGIEDEKCSKSSSLLQTFSPKSVFAAGTAKRTAELMKRKAPLVSEEEEQHEKEHGRRTGTKTGMETIQFNK